MTVTTGRARRIEVAEGVGLEVLEWAGEGHPYVLLHGLASNARLWDGVASHLAAAGHRVVAVDQRGHGRSDKPSDGYDLTTVTDDLRALLDATSLDRPVLVGQSWGANVVVEFAARFPGVASAVACIDGGAIDLSRRFPDWEACATALRPPPLTGIPFTEIEARIRAGHPDWPETGIQGTLACFEVRDDGTVAPWLDLEHHLLVLRGLWEHHPHERLALVREPMLFLLAGDGSSRMHAGLEDTVAGLDGVRVEWMVGDHDLHAQHPDTVAERVATLTATPGIDR